MIDVKLDIANWAKLLADHSAMANVSMGASVTAAARIWLRGAIRLTVPSGPGAELNKTSAQKKLGEELVKRDVGRLFVEWNDLRQRVKSARLVDALNSNLGEKLNFKAAAAILRNAGFDFAGVITKPRRFLHDARKNRRGHIRAKERPFLVAESGSVHAYLADNLKKVGIAKAGWKRAAAALRVKLPAWVMRHSAPGTFRSQMTGDRPSIEFGNPVKHANANGPDDKVMSASRVFAAKQFQKSLAVYFKEIQRGNAARLRAKVQKDAFEAIEA